MSNRRVVLGPLWLMLGVLASAVGLLQTPSFAANPTKWCIMFYYDGNNSLESYAIRDIYQMQMAIRTLDATKATPDPTIRVFVQLNRYKPPQGAKKPVWDNTEDSDYAGCHRFELNWADPKTLTMDQIPSDDLKKGAMDVSDVPIDMTDPGNLQDFMTWAIKKCPKSDHYALILPNRYSAWGGPPTGLDRRPTVQAPRRRTWAPSCRSRP